MPSVHSVLIIEFTTFQIEGLKSQNHMFVESSNLPGTIFPDSTFENWPYAVQALPPTVLRCCISEGLTQAESYFQEVEFSCPQGVSRRFRVSESLHG